MSVLGPGAVCCGDPVGCAVECDQKELLGFVPEELTDLDDVLEELDVDLSEEEDDE